MLDKRLLGKHGEQIVYVEPGLVRVSGQQSVCNAEQEASEALPPISAKFGAKVADSVVKELACVLEEQATLLIWSYLHAFVCSFKVQGQANELSINILVQKGAGDIGASGQGRVRARSTWD